MQPWEKDRYRTQGFSFRKKIKQYGNASVFAIACVSAVYGCLLKKYISDSIKSKNVNN
jgi:hypothetical protein